MMLFCLRHAESTYNAQGRIQGHLNVPLSPLGRRQSEAVAAALAGEPIEAVYSSPLLRAVQTAEPLARVLNLEIRVLPGLIELNAGIFQGKSHRELAELHPAEWARWRSGDPDYAIPGGESRRDLMRRGRQVLEEILALGHRQVVISSHGALLAGAMKALLDIPAWRHPFRLQNAAIHRLEVSGKQVRLHSFNSVEHLREVGLAGSGDL
jgi:probable phosphoglycerate mutase